MALLPRLASLWRNLTDKESADHELNEELRAHVDLTLAGPVRNQIAALDKDQAVFNVRTMEQALSRSVAAQQFSMILLAVFAMLALVLAAVGIYGVISYSVAQRTREVGIRMTLGARTIDVIKLVVRDGLKLVLIGVGVGLAGAFALTRLMATLRPSAFSAINGAPKRRERRGPLRTSRLQD